MNYLGKFDNNWFYEKNGVVYIQKNIETYERWGDLGLFNYLKEKGLLK